MNHRLVMFHPLTMLIVASFAISTVALANSEPTSGPIARYATKGKFEDVRDDVLFAVRARGLVVDHTSHIQSMLERTGKDLGTTRSIYRRAEAFSFCSAVESRKMMEADPHYIALCPYVITVYALPHDAERVYVAFRRPAFASHDKALQDIEALLDGIVREALGIQ